MANSVGLLTRPYSAGAFSLALAIVIIAGAACASGGQFANWRKDLPEKCRNDAIPIKNFRGRFKMVGEIPMISVNGELFQVGNHNHAIDYSHVFMNYEQKISPDLEMSGFLENKIKCSVVPNRVFFVFKLKVLGE